MAIHEHHRKGMDRHFQRPRDDVWGGDPHRAVHCERPFCRPESCLLDMAWHSPGRHRERPVFEFENCIRTMKRRSPSRHCDQPVCGPANCIRSMTRGSPSRHCEPRQRRGNPRIPKKKTWIATAFGLAMTNVLATPIRSVHGEERQRRGNPRAPQKKPWIATALGLAMTGVWCCEKKRFMQSQALPLSCCASAST